MDGLAELLPPLAEDRPGIGHNQPPLTELLAEETVALKSRADDLIASAGRAKVEDDETAGRATTLAKMLAEHSKAIDKAREERKAPFLEAGRTVDRHFGALKQPVDVAKGQVVALLDAYRRKKEAEAAAERRRLEEEARKAREAAEAAERERRRIEEEAARQRREAEEAQRRAEEEARRQGDAAKAAEAARAREAAARQRAEEERKADEERLAAEVEARRQRERADELAKQAAETTAAPIASEYGQKAFAKKVFKARITDLTAAIRHCRKVDEAAIREAVQKIYDRQVRAGVRELPGADVTEDSATVIR